MSKATKGSSTSVLASSEEQDEVRRANKAKKRHQAATRPAGAPVATRENPHTSWRRPTTLHYGAVRTPQERAAAEQAKERELVAETSRIKYATKALESTNISTLEKDSIAYKVAVSILHFFPLVTVNKEVTGKGRVAEAIAAAKAGLTPSESARSKAVDLGINRARWALNWAHAQTNQA